MSGLTGSPLLQPAELLASLSEAFTSGLSTVWSPSPLPGMTTVATGRFHRRDFHPLDRHLASLHQILDFYHASQYLARAAAAICKNEEEREQWLDKQCHNLKHKHNAAPRILKELEQAITTKMKPEQRKDLQECITYFGNHLHQMRYARYVENGMPIGSGVTEAACKTLVKQRLCCSGMRWTPEGAQIILSLRALALTQTRWEQFWQKINQYGVPEITKH
jgi:hypothetical protein